MIKDIDHVHLHTVIPPKYAVSLAVETIKKNTTRSLGLKFRFLEHIYWDKRGIWSKGFFVSTISINEAIIKQYVEMQAKEGTEQAQLELR